MELSICTVSKQLCAKNSSFSKTSIFRIQAKVYMCPERAEPLPASVSSSKLVMFQMANKALARDWFPRRPSHLCGHIHADLDSSCKLLSWGARYLERPSKDAWSVLPTHQHLSLKEKGKKLRMYRKRLESIRMWKHTCSFLQPESYCLVTFFWEEEEMNSASAKIYKKNMNSSGQYNSVGGLTVRQLLSTR